MEVFIKKLLITSMSVVVLSLQVQSQMPVEKDNLQALLNFLRTIPPKDEFEKTAEYDKKVVKLLNKEVYEGRSGDSIWTAVGYVGIFGTKIEYDPDNEIMTFPFAPTYWHLLPKGSQCTSAIDSNGAAEDLALIFTNYDNFFTITPRLTIKNNVSYATISVSNADAPSLKANARVAYFFRPAKPFTGDCVTRPSIAATLEAVQIFDSRTGKVFFDTRPKGAVPIKARFEPVIVNGGVLNGKATSLAMPVWPASANAVRLAASQVVVEVLVSEDGNVISAKGVSGPPILFKAAVTAALKSRFNPTLLSGQPIKVKGSIQFNYVPRH